MRYAATFRRGRRSSRHQPRRFRRIQHLSGEWASLRAVEGFPAHPRAIGTPIPRRRCRPCRVHLRRQRRPSASPVCLSRTSLRTVRSLGRGPRRQHHRLTQGQTEAVAVAMRFLRRLPPRLQAVQVAHQEIVRRRGRPRRSSRACCGCGGRPRRKPGYQPPGWRSPHPPDQRELRRTNRSQPIPQPALP